MQKMSGKKAFLIVGFLLIILTGFSLFGNVNLIKGIVPKEESTTSSQQVLYLKDFGVTANSSKDQTAGIQKAFKAASEQGKKLIINKGDYWINGTEGADSKQYLHDRGGIKVYSNTEILFEKGAVFKIIPNRYDAYIGLRLWDVENVKIIGATLVGDRLKHQSKSGEWGYGIFVAGSKNVTLSHITVSNFWGDGINLNCANLASGLKINYDIFIDNIRSFSNRRQGLTIEAGRNVTISNSEFRNNRGTAPESGIDIEPWSEEYENVRDVNVINCKFIDNPQGLMVNFPNLQSINITSCSFTATAPGKVERHIWQLYGENELRVSKSFFDENAVNVLINAGKKTEIESCELNGQIRIDAPSPSDVTISNNKLNKAIVSAENRSSGRLQVINNQLLSNSKVELRGSIISRITGNNFKNSEDVFVSDYSTGTTLVEGNTMFNSKYQAIGTTGNITISSNRSDKSEVFVWIRENAKNVSLIGNRFTTTIGQMLSVENPSSNENINIRENIAQDNSIQIQDFQTKLFNNKSNTYRK